MALSREEIDRYSRHLLLPGFGIETQEKLKDSSVLVIGAGGLGSPILQYLTAAGVGRIGIVDFDQVDASNLQRQVLYDHDDVGKPKAETAAARLRAQNPNTSFEVHPHKLSSENALEIISAYDVVADGSDNFPTRYLVNDACVLSGKPLVFGSIYQYEGQVSVFNYTDDTGVTGPNYRDLFPAPPPPGMVPSCAEGGVLGVLPGIVGSIQALETIKVLVGTGETLSGRLLLLEAQDLKFRSVNIRKDPENPLTGANPTLNGLIDYEEFCGLNDASGIPAISVEDLRKWQEEGRDFVLLDVREPFEHEVSNLGGMLIPAGLVYTNSDKIPTGKDVVVYCKSGVRSARVVRELATGSGYSNLYNLEGGIQAWKEAIDPQMPVI